MEPIQEFAPFQQMVKRIQNSKDQSDPLFFNELLLFGEMLTKLVTISLVASIQNDRNRNRYRLEHRLVRANAIGDWASSISEMLDGVVSQYLIKTVREKELIELSRKCKNGDWQYEALKLLSEAAGRMKVYEMEDIGAKAPLKQWFINFTILRNKTRGHGAFTATQASEACIPLERSLFLIANNLSFFQRCWAYLYQNFSGKYRITKLSKNSIPFDYLKTTDQYKSSFSNGIYIYLDEIRRVSLMFSNPELEDFFFPNGNFKSDKFEALSYCSGERQQIVGVEYLVPAENLPSSETEGLGNLEIQGNSFGNIPPKVKYYVNRRGLEPELERVLKEENRYPIVTLVGKGGIGKTSLALTILHRISEIGIYDVILWFSARDIDLLSEGAKPVKAKVLTVNDIAKEFVKLLGISSDKSKSPEEYLIEAMGSSDTKNGKILFVFDNFETVYNPIELFKWIDTYIRLPNKVLITSRESRDFKADFPIEVIKMDNDECHELIKITAQSLEITDLLTKSYINSLIEESNGHPYIIKILLGEVAKGNRLPKKIERIVAGREDILLALFRRTFNSLSLSAKRVFLTLCSWRSTIPLVALEAVLLRPENEERIDVEGAIEELRRSSFVDITATEGNEIFVGVPLAASIYGKTELDVSSQKIYILEDRELLLEFGVGKDSDIKIGIKPRIERKFHSIGKKLSSDRLVDKNKYLNVHLPVLEYLCRHYPEGWLLLADLYEIANNFDGIIDSIQNFLKEKRITNDQKRDAWKLLAQIFREKGNWEGESHALSEVCLLPDSDFQDISEVANRMNTYFKDNKEIDSEHKKLIIKGVAEIMDRRISSEGYATDYSRLAWLYLNLKNEQRALEIAKFGLEKDPNNDYCQKIVTKLERPNGYLTA